MKNIAKYIKLHIDHGLEAMEHLLLRNSEDYSIFDFFKETINQGVHSLKPIQQPQPSIYLSKTNKASYPHPIKIEVGKRLQDSAPLYLHLNDTRLHNNCHIAVAGKPGSGKTQFALDFLWQIHEQSNGMINFIYLDFKGSKPNNGGQMETFFRSTNTTFIDMPQKPFPANPLAFIDRVNETNCNLGIDKFVDIVCAASEKLGSRQKGFLRRATQNVFMETSGHLFPTIEQINQQLQAIMPKEKDDTLTGIMDDLTRYRIFADDREGGSDFLSSNIYLSLGEDLPESVRFTSLFLIIYYLYTTFMSMEDSPVENDIKALRYVLLIDEAHTLFKVRKYHDMLEKILREIRSKGVSVTLLSQGIGEYNQGDFDFSSMCDITILLDIKDKNNRRDIERFLGLHMDDKTKRNISDIHPRQAISNIKECGVGHLFKIQQYRERMR